MSGKKFADAVKTFDRDQLFTPTEAVTLVKALAKAKFDESVDIAIRLGVDPRKADQMVRGTVALPEGTGKDVRVAVFAAGEAAQEARDAGADIVGADDLAGEIQKGNMDFDLAIATPDMMPLVGRLGRVLGPRGLMPNPKTGTVTQDVGRAVAEFKGGKVEYRTDRYGNVHVPIGKVELRARGAGAQLPRRARRVAACQAGIGQGSLPARRSRSRRRWAPASRSTPPACAPRSATPISGSSVTGETAGSVAAQPSSCSPKTAGPSLTGTDNGFAPPAEVNTLDRVMAQCLRSSWCSLQSEHPE